MAKNTNKPTKSKPSKENDMSIDAFIDSLPEDCSKKRKREPSYKGKLFLNINRTFILLLIILIFLILLYYNFNLYYNY